MVKALIYHPGDRWFESGRSHFGEKLDYFMRFEVYSAVRVRLQLGGKLKKFKRGDSLIKHLTNSNIKHFFRVEIPTEIERTLNISA